MPLMELTLWVLSFAHLYDDPGILELVQLHKRRALCSERLIKYLRKYIQLASKEAEIPAWVSLILNLRCFSPGSCMQEIACNQKKHQEHVNHMKDPGIENARGQFDVK